MSQVDAEKGTSRLIVAVEPPSGGAVLLYEAEWNEQASLAEHREAVVFFAQQAGLAEVDVTGLVIGPDDAVWITAEDTSEDPCTDHGYEECPDCGDAGVAIGAGGYYSCTRFLTCWTDVSEEGSA